MSVHNYFTRRHNHLMNTNLIANNVLISLIKSLVYINEKITIDKIETSNSWNEQFLERAIYDLVLFHIYLDLLAWLLNNWESINQYFFSIQGCDWQKDNILLLECCSGCFNLYFFIYVTVSRRKDQNAKRWESENPQNLYMAKKLC